MCLFNNKFSINKCSTMKLQALPRLPEFSVYFLGLESQITYHTRSIIVLIFTLPKIISSPFVKETTTQDFTLQIQNWAWLGMAQSVGSVIPFCACKKGSFAELTSKASALLQKRPLKSFSG